MARELWLLRHAKAEDGGRRDDFDRDLKKRGRLAAVRLGQWMQQQGLYPDWVICSPAVRAVATAYGLCPSLGITEPQIHKDIHLYAADVKALKSVLAHCPETAQRVLLVGHNPGLEDLLADLAISLPMLPKLMPTATLVRLKMPDNWQQLRTGCAELLAITQAKALLPQD